MEIKEHEVVRKIKVNREWTWFVQAMLEDTHLVSVSLGEDFSLTIFYDIKVENLINEVLENIQEFCK
jgi:hypothetical protein